MIADRGGTFRPFVLNTSRISGCYRVVTPGGKSRCRGGGGDGVVHRELVEDGRVADVHGELGDRRRARRRRALSPRAHRQLLRDHRRRRQARTPGQRRERHQGAPGLRHAAPPLRERPVDQRGRLLAPPAAPRAARVPQGPRRGHGRADDEGRARDRRAPSRERRLGRARLDAPRDVAPDAQGRGRRPLRRRVGREVRARSGRVDRDERAARRALQSAEAPLADLADQLRPRVSPGAAHALLAGGRHHRRAARRGRRRSPLDADERASRGHRRGHDRRPAPRRGRHDAPGRARDDRRRASTRAARS